MPLSLSDQYEVIHPVTVIEGIVANGILGMDFLAKERAIIDTAAQCVRIPSVPSSWATWSHPHAEAWAIEHNPTQPAQAHPRGICTALRQYALLPFSATNVRARVFSPAGTPIADTDGCIDPLPPPALGGAAALESLNRTDRRGDTHIVIFNTSHQRIVIEENAEIAFFQPEDADKMFDLAAIVDAASAAQPTKDISCPIPITPEHEKYITHNAAIAPGHKLAPDILSLLHEFHDVISTGPYDIGGTAEIEHKIRINTEQPVHVKQFRIPDAHDACIKDYVRELLAKDCIQLSNSPYNSPVFCVPKHNGELRVVQDFRALNFASFDDKYVFREIQACLDEIGKRKSAVFSTIDLTSGFWQQSLEPSSRPYTSFTIPGQGRYEWLRTPMGLKGSSSSFARLMDHVMRGVDGALTYIDDVLVHSPDNPTHLHDLRECLTRLRKYNLKLNLKKCTFGTRSVKYLGFTVSADGVTPDADKLAAIRDRPPPATIKQIREFIGLAN